MGKLRPGKVTVIANSDNYPKGYHAGNVGGLDAIDTDLAVGNIKDGITIFGKVGTLSLVEDLVDSDIEDVFDSGVSSTYYRRTIPVGAGADFASPATVTPTFTAGSLAVGVGHIAALAATASTLKFRLYMGGTQVAETDYMDTSLFKIRLAIGTRALSGAQEIKATMHNYGGSQANWYTFSNSSSPYTFQAVAVGSVKT